MEGQHPADMAPVEGRERLRLAAGEEVRIAERVVAVAHKSYNERATPL
jgi:hypothetical protein